MPKVSVIVPVYKVEQYLVECLDSVANQSLHDIEIICVDDGSPDGCWEIMCRYAEQDGRFIPLQHEKNRGLGAARNTGIEYATGEYIFFLDSDDYLLPDGLENLYFAARKHRVAVVDAPLKRYLEDEGCYKRVRVKKKGLVTITNAAFDVLEYNVFRLFRADIFANKSIRFPPRLIHEDIEFYWKVFTKYPQVYCIGEPVLIYRIRGGSITSSPKKDYDQNNIGLIKNIFAYLQENGLLMDYRKAFTREYYHCYYKLRDEEAERYKGVLLALFAEEGFELSFSLRAFRKNLLTLFKR